MKRRSFLAASGGTPEATLLPGGSELVFLGVLASGSSTLWPALGVADETRTLAAGW